MKKYKNHAFQIVKHNQDQKYEFKKMRVCRGTTNKFPFFKLNTLDIANSCKAFT